MVLFRIRRIILTLEPKYYMDTSIQKFPYQVRYAHWITLFLVLVAYFTSESPILDQWLGQVHVLAGSTVFIFFFIRLTLYFHFKSQFPEVPRMTQFQEKAFRWMKVCLYLCLFVVPFLGWLALSMTQTHFSLFGIDLPLIKFSKHYNIGGLHQIIANIFMTLIGLHALAALFHHFILKDNVLKSMK
ncbi:MAG: cytochrome b/b6 domain-containing protein [Acinetobacter sp.]|nr:cytochrome b/b6 domain-containing protein [Acinetobacter sp.]